MNQYLTCPAQLEPLGCGQSGMGVARCTQEPGRLDLHTGQGANFPTPTAGRTYWVDVRERAGCGACQRLQVVGKDGDTLLVLALPGGAAVGTGATQVVYASASPEHIQLLAQEIGVNAVAPLRYDCATRRLWIDCEELKNMLARPCAT